MLNSIRPLIIKCKTSGTHMKVSLKNKQWSILLYLKNNDTQANDRKQGDPVPSG